MRPPQFPNVLVPDLTPQRPQIILTLQPGGQLHVQLQAVPGGWPTAIKACLQAVAMGVEALEQAQRVVQPVPLESMPLTRL